MNFLGKLKSVFVCEHCGYESSKWMGRCPNCDSWDSFKENITEVKKNTSAYTINSKRKDSVRLSQVQSSNSDRIVTNINEFNRVMGGGIIKDSITIITAKPGAGKSTLLLQVANDIASQGRKVLYASGEESDSQIKNRADRILNKIEDNIWIVADTSMNNVIKTVSDINPDLIIVDSIQTFVMEEQLPSRAGSPTQTMECAN